MDARQYQLEAARTLISEPGFEIPGIDIMLVWCSVGLSGESGEIAELIKKEIFHRHKTGVEFNTKLFKEIGDCLWYLAGLCTIMGMDMGEVMQANIDKLKVRYPNGFNSQDSISRKDVSNA